VARLTGPVDVLHAVDGVPPPTSAPVVLTVHDLLPVVLPHLYSPRHLRTTAGHVAATRKATVLVADCETTADQVSEITGVARDRIVVAPLGHREPAAELPPPVVAPPYILAVGAVTPRKSFHLLVEAVGRLGDLGPPVVVAGPPGWRAEEVHEHIAALGLEDRVSFLGRVSDIELESLYRHAELLCHPSIAEGFGIPCLEALGYGVPAVAADIPSVREFGADAVLLVPPGDVEALADALAAVLSDPDRRAAMATAGLRRAERYTWAHTAEGVARAYRLAAQ
jgi:glycosyltransferase involved in cell wall biosynthesis